MADNQELQQIVERAVAQVFADQMPRLQSEVIQSVMQSLPPVSGMSSTQAHSAAGSETNGARGDARNLQDAVAGIQAGNNQKDILRALLDGGSSCCERIALFVIKAGQASGWQARGFANDEAIKDFVLDMSAGPIAHAYGNRASAPANIAEMDRRFAESFGGPANEQLVLVPLVLKDKVAALLYADGGATGALDASAIEMLVSITSAWLELTSLRKQTQKETIDSAYAEPAPTAQASYPEPFPGQTPAAMAASVAPADSASTQAVPAMDSTEIVEAEPAKQAAAAGASAGAVNAVAAAPQAAMSAEDQDTHRKAQRFARLLVDEIKLYNQAKVTEGRRNRDLYDRLKEDIEKSRGTYMKRFNGTAAANTEYFQQELVRSLAEDDPSVMGAGFRQ